MWGVERQEVMGAHSLAWLALPLHHWVTPSKPLHRSAAPPYSVQGRLETAIRRTAAGIPGEDVNETVLQTQKSQINPGLKISLMTVVELGGLGSGA